MAQELPEYKRSQGIEAGSATPNYGDAMREVGAATNTLSEIGATVAQSSSTAMATQLGYQQGQNPKGDLLPPITQFDKTFADSYHTQANATLSLQGSKLLSDAQIQMAQASNLTPDLIANTNKQVALGLSKITDQAPTAIKGDLQNRFGAQMLDMNNKYQLKMISQQRSDESNNLLAGLHNNAKTVFELASAGNFDAAQKIVEQTKAMADTGVSTHHIDKLQAQTAFETVQSSALHAKYIHEALNAKENGNLEQWEKSFASKKPDDLTFEQWNSTGNAVSSYMGTLKALSAQEEQITTLKMDESIVQDVGGITGNMLADYKAKVSPLEYEQTYLKYLTALKKNSANTALANVGVAGFSNPDVYARLSPEAQNQAADIITQKVLKDAQTTGTPITLDQAEAQVAARAAGPITKYINVLNAKLRSTDPVNIESAGKSIEYIQQVEKGGNLSGLTDQSNAMYNLYTALRRSHPAEEAAQIAYDSVYNQKEDEKKIVNENWLQVNRTIQQDALPYYTSLGGVSKDNLIDPQGYVEQASSLLESYYKWTKGDLETAKKMTAQAISSSYGESHINGRKETTFLPLENVIGLPADSAGFIQDDIINQVSDKLSVTKKAFDDGKSDYYWELEPRVSPDAVASRTEKTKAGVLEKGFTKDSLSYQFANSREQESFSEGKPMIVHRIWRNGVRETYPLIVKADPWLVKLNNQNKPYGGAWDVVVGTDSGIKPLHILNPGMGSFLYYEPNITKIRSNYAKHHNVGT